MVRRHKFMIGFLVAGIAVWGSLSPARAGFNTIGSSGYNANDEHTGWPLTPPDLIHIAAATAKLRAAGKNGAAAQIDNMVKHGQVCRECEKAGCAWTDPDKEKSTQGDRINVVPQYLSDTTAWGVEWLAIALLHEWGHAIAGGGSSYEEEHCLILWQEYVYISNRYTQRQNSGQNQTPDDQDAQAGLFARLEQIEGWYPNFTAAPLGGKCPTDPPPPTGDDCTLARDHGITAANNNIYQLDYVTNASSAFKEQIIWHIGGAVSYEVRNIQTMFAHTTTSWFYRTTDGRPVMVVGGKNAAGDHSGIQVFTDSNADGIVDQGSVVAGFGAGLANVTSVIVMPVLGSPAKLYAFDYGQGKIYNLTLTSEVPSALGTTFATSAVFPDLAGMKFLTMSTKVNELGEIDGPSFLAASNLPYGFDSVESGKNIMVFKDNDADGVADATTGAYAAQSHVEFSPTMVSGPFTGSNAARLYGVVGSTLQLWSLNGSGQLDQLLGSGTAASDGRVTVNLTRALAMGEFIRLRDATFSLESPSIEIVARTPLIWSVDTKAGPRTGGTTVTVTGECFCPNSQVFFDDVAATVVSSNTTQVVITTPNLGAEDVFETKEIRIVPPPGHEEAGGFYFLFRPE